MADMFTLDCQVQFNLLRQHRGNEGVLAPMLESMCNTLAMGVEEYVRPFDASQGIELLSDICLKNITTLGDAGVMCVRALALTLENVPKAIEAGHNCPALIGAVRGKLENMLAYRYDQYGSQNLCEDCLKVIALLSEADTKGRLAGSGILATIVTAIGVVDIATAARCVAAVTALVERLHLPTHSGISVRGGLPPGAGDGSATDGLSTGGGSRSSKSTAGGKQQQKGKLSKGGGKTPASSSEPLPTRVAATVRNELSIAVVPALHALLQALVGSGEDTGSDTAPQNRDVWPTMEAVLECLEAIVYRAAVAAHAFVSPAPASKGEAPGTMPVSPWLAPMEVQDTLVDAVLTPSLIATVLRCLTTIATEERRQLAVFTFLTTVAQFRRSALRVPLMEPHTVQYFADLLAPGRRDFSALLANVFPRKAIASSSHVGGSTTSAALPHGSGGSTTGTLLLTSAAYFLFWMAPPVPNPEMRVHFRIVPLHKWEWADDMHTFTDYADDACATLEAARLSAVPSATIRVRNSTYCAEIATMRQVNPGSGVSRSIKRGFIPKGYVFVDWATKVEGLCPALSGQPPADTPSTSPPLALSGRPAEAVLDLLRGYSPLLTLFAQSASGEIHRSLAAGAVTRLISSVTTPYPPAAFYSMLEEEGDKLCAFLAGVLSSAEDLVTIDATFALLHILFAVAGQDAEVELSSPRYSPNPDAGCRAGHSVTSFAGRCRRFAVAKKLASLASRLRAKLGGGAAGGDAAAAEQRSGSGSMGSERQDPSAVSSSSGGAGRGGSTSASSSLDGCAQLVARASTLLSLCDCHRSAVVAAVSGGMDSDENVSFADTLSDLPGSANPGSPSTAAPPLSAAAAHFRSLPDGPAKESFLPELLRVVEEHSDRLTVHEYGTLGLNTSLAHFLRPQPTPNRGSGPSTDLSRARVAQFAAGLSKSPKAAAVLVRMLTAEMGLTSRRLPEVQGTGSHASYDRCRPWQEALAKMKDLCPNVDLCCARQENDEELKRRVAIFRSEEQPRSETPTGRGRRRAASRGGRGASSSAGSQPPPRCPKGHVLQYGTSLAWGCDSCERSFQTPTSWGCRTCDFDLCGDCAEDPAHRVAMCPEGHPLVSGTTSRWTCDECSNSFRTPNSNGCRSCDYDICEGCLSSANQRAYIHPPPAKPRLPGVRAHLLATVGDLEAFFRLPAGERASRAASMNAPTGGIDGPFGGGLDHVLAMLASGGPDGADDGLAMLRALVSGSIANAAGGPGSRGRGGGRGGSRGGGGGGRLTDATTTPSLGGATDVPPLAPGAVRRDLYYPGLGRVPMQETLYGCLYRKAVGLGLWSAVDALEQAIMAPTAGGQGATPPSAACSPQAGVLQSPEEPPSAGLGSAPTTPPQRPSPLTPPHGASSPGLPPDVAAVFADEPVTRQRVHYFHVLRPTTNRTAPSSSFSSGSDDDNAAVAAHCTSDRRCCCGELATAAPTPVVASSQALTNGSDNDDDDQSRLVVLSKPQEGAAVLLDQARVNLAGRSPTLAAMRKQELAHSTRFTLLRILFGLCAAPPTPLANGALASAASVAPRLPLEAFASHELGVKAVKAAASSALRVVCMPPQLALPTWLVEVLTHAPFLLPTPTLHQLLHFVAGGARRSLNEAVQTLGMFASPVRDCTVAPAEWSLAGANIATGARPPVKEVINKAELAQQADKVLRLSAERRAGVMIEFEGDKGTGQGPTMQFFTLIAEQALVAGRGWWRGDDDDAALAQRQNLPTGGAGQGSYPTHHTHSSSTSSSSRGGPRNQRYQDPTAKHDGADNGACPTTVQYLHVAHEGLYPAAVAGGRQREGQLQLMYLCGAACGRALLDGRVFPLPLSTFMFETLRRRCGFHHRSATTAAAGSPPSIADVALVDKAVARSLGSLRTLAARHADGDAAAASEIESLALVFVRPDDDAAELIPNGSTTDVTADNLSHYIDRVCHSMLFESVQPALDSFASGFEDVVPADALLAADAATLTALITGVGDDEAGPLWSAEDLAKTIVGDHGYGRESRELVWLRDLLVQFSPPQQRAFLRFATGCPRLPVGGLRALGKITVVRKDACANGKLGLPSVNTCFRYLKLPPYPDAQTLRASLLVAVTEAGDGFDLS